MQKKNLFPLCILSLIVVIFEGCGLSAPNPMIYTTATYNEFWQPAEDGIPLPPRSLMYPYVCCCTPAEVSDDPASLCDLIDVGLRNSPLTREKWADARIAAARFGEQQASYYPEVNFNGFVEFLRTAAFFGGEGLLNEGYEDYGAAIELTYLLFDSGTRRNQTEMFRQQLLQANWTYNREIQTVVQTIIIQYYNTMAFREQLKAGEANLRDAMTTLEATEKKHSAGIADLSDVLIAQTEVAKEETQLLDVTQNWKDALASLKADIGIPANTCMEVEPLQEIQDLEVVDPSVDPYLAQAYLSRPDLFAAFSAVKSNIANVRAAISNQYPTFELNGEVGRTYFNEGRTDEYDYNVQLTFAFPLFKGWEYRNQIRQAEAQLERVRAKLRNLELQMIEQVVQSHQDFLISIDKVKVNRIYVKTAEMSFQSALKKYRAGTTDITTVVNAQANLADARYSLINAKRDWYNSLTDLAYATGTMCASCRR